MKRSVRRVTSWPSAVQVTCSSSMSPTFATDIAAINRPGGRPRTATGASSVVDACW
jgi:hypothetical protein